VREPVITVITPSLNARATVEQTLRSVQTQDYPHVEHVVIDGGSTDGTVEILEKAEGIKFISERDGGLSDAMNKGIARATGDVIGWLNADDYYLPGALSRVAEAFRANPDALWATGRCLIIDGRGREIRRPVKLYKNFLLRNYRHWLYLTQNFIAAPATFVHKRGYELAGPYDQRFRISMDYDLFLRLAKLGDPIVINSELSCFRMAHASGSLSMSGFERQFQEHAQNAREHGDGHPVSVAVNQVLSRMSVAAYKSMRWLRDRRVGALGGR
jgi:glycosyltransferase involved in cell wall biosynthesis